MAPFAIMFAISAARADGLVVDRVYDPYVQPLEKEVEWRSVFLSDDDTSDLQRHWLGFGKSLSDRWAIELYAIGSKADGDSLSVDAYEIEAKWQITEQGEFAFDWGMNFELERETSENVWEAAATILVGRDLGRWTTYANLGLVYEWGAGVSDEFETVFHMQARYRLREALEPALELHIGEETTALGPMLTGLYRLSPGKKLRWDFGLYRRLDNKTPDHFVKLNLEYEF
jgi:hypothetical protein